VDLSPDSTSIAALGGGRAAASPWLMVDDDERRCKCRGRGAGSFDVQRSRCPVSTRILQIARIVAELRVRSILGLEDSSATTSFFRLLFHDRRAWYLRRSAESARSDFLRSTPLPETTQSHPRTGANPASRWCRRSCLTLAVSYRRPNAKRSRSRRMLLKTRSRRHRRSVTRPRHRRQRGDLLHVTSCSGARFQYESRVAW